MKEETPAARAAREILERQRFAGMPDGELIRRTRESRSRLLAAGLGEEVEALEAEFRRTTPTTKRRQRT